MDNITLYTIIFYFGLLIPIGGVYLLTKPHKLQFKNFYFNYLSWIFITCFFSLVAFRPIGEFGFPDTLMYINWFNDAKFDNTFPTKDLGFGFLIFFFAKFFSVRLFFMFCTFLTIAILYWISIKIARRYWFLYFLGTMVSLYFWNQQIFTIRQGLASLIFLAALFQKEWLIQILFLLIAVSFHKSFLLPLFCYLLIIIFDRRVFYVVLWVVSIPISYFFGNHITASIVGYLPAEILYYYPDVSIERSFSDFRWDVILYSAIFIILPFKFRNNDEIYLKISNLYILINVFVIMMIWPSVYYIHRFAYLSWFLAPVIVFYPLLHKEKITNFTHYFFYLLFFYIMILLYLGLKLYQQDFTFVNYISPHSN